MEKLIEENDALENYTGQDSTYLLTLNPHDALQDVNIFIAQSKQSLVSEGFALYDKYAPQLVRAQVEKGFELLHSEKVWPYYQKYENVLHIAFTGIAILIGLQVIKTIFGFFGYPSIADESQPEVPVTIYTEKDFETIPLCVGKGDAEELLVANSYSEILQTSNDENFLKRYDPDHDTTSDSISKSDMSILRSLTPNKDDSPTDFTNSDISAIFKDDNIENFLETPIKIEDESKSDESNSTSPDDSFKKQEDLLDDQLANLNSTSMVMDNSSGSNSIDQYSTSPSKLIYKKTSISILTNAAAFPKAPVADTTVGDITEETVYSEPFAGDESTSFKNSV